MCCSATKGAGVAQETGMGQIQEADLCCPKEYSIPRYAMLAIETGKKEVGGDIQSDDISLSEKKTMMCGEPCSPGCG